MYDYLTQLHQKLLFTREDVIAITGSKDRASALLLNFQSKGLISKVRRNLYCVVNLATHIPEASKMQVASAVSPSSAIAYHSALEYHGFAHQVFFEMNVISDTRFIPFEYDGIRYNYLHNPIPDGIVVPPSDYKIRVTNIERTILDCIDRIDLCGGVEELIHSLTSIQYVDSHLLADYLKAYGKVALYKKAGYIFTLLKDFIHLPEEILSICHDQGSRSTAVLTTIEPCTSYIKEWKLYVPQNITTYIENSNYGNL